MVGYLLSYLFQTVSISRNNDGDDDILSSPLFLLVSYIRSLSFTYRTARIARRSP